MDQNKLDNQYMRTALVEAYKSDESFKVGSCIVDQNGKVVATGHNRLLPNCRDLYNSYVALGDTKSMQYCCVNRAAEAALNCAHKFSNCTLYQNTFPTPYCIKDMIKKGITGLVHYCDFRNGYQDMYKCTASLLETQKDTLKVRYFYLEDEDDLTRCMRKVIMNDDRQYKQKPRKGRGKRINRNAPG